MIAYSEMHDLDTSCEFEKNNTASFCLSRTRAPKSWRRSCCTIRIGYRVVLYPNTYFSFYMPTGLFPFI